MDGQLLLGLLLLLLGASGLQGQGPGPGGPSEGPPDEEEEQEEEEVPEEDGILVLNRRTLGLALREHPALLVEFYAPWCGQCKALAPEYSKAAALLAAEAAKARLAKVDGPAEPELAEEFAVTEYPTLKFFRDGNRTHPEEYTGPREAQGIAEWLRRRVGPSATQLEDEEGARVLMRAWDVVVIGFFQDLQDKDVATFLAVAQDALDMAFGLTDRPQLFQKFGLTKDTVVLFKKYDEGRADFPVDKELGLDQGDLSRFLLTHSMHLVTEFTPQTSPKIFAARIPNHLLLFINQTLAAHLERLSGFREAAPRFRGQYFGLKAEEAPTLRFVNMETTKKYAPADKEPVTATSVAAFCRAVLGGELKPYRLSQEIPPDWDQRPVKTLVGKNFEQTPHGAPTARRWPRPGRRWLRSTKTMRTSSSLSWTPRPTSWRPSLCMASPPSSTSRQGQVGRQLNTKAPGTWKLSPSFWTVGVRCLPRSPRSHPDSPSRRRQKTPRSPRTSCSHAAIAVHQGRPVSGAPGS
ncbi:protein disulfide-isomerase A2 isoform X2 [Sus scrofa]|uniref:protein disulfide-isomerase A2 isoform X2 n=1 Tax=Sus scrofa TaxID=9823 RepID=UPI000A2AFFAD|nr:protein disulfide-isomerase A2 isoform X2 [Sus scrofa]